MAYDEAHINIRRARELIGLSQSELADELDIGRTTYVNFETGKTKLYSKILSKMAQFLGKTEEELLFGNALDSGQLEEDANYIEREKVLINDYEERIQNLLLRIESFEKVINTQEKAITSLSETNKFLYGQLNKNN